MTKPSNDKKPRKSHFVSRGMLFPKNYDLLNGRTRRALKSDGYELKESTAVLKLIKEGDVVMELGGGIGYMSTLIATHTRAARIHSFEANPQLIPYIQSVHQANGLTNTTIEHAVLGLENAQATFFVRKNFLASSLSREDADGVVSEHPVTVLDVNETLARVNPSVIVCDIEGGEVALLPAMDMSDVRAVLVELHPQFTGKEGVAKVMNAMHQKGLIYFPRWSHGKVVCFRRDW